MLLAGYQHLKVTHWLWNGCNHFLSCSAKSHSIANPSKNWCPSSYYICSYLLLLSLFKSNKIYELMHSSDLTTVECWEPVVKSHHTSSCLLLGYFTCTCIYPNQSSIWPPQQPKQAWATHVQRAHLQAPGLGSRGPGGAAAPRAQHPSPLPRGPHGVPEGQIPGPASGAREIPRSRCARQPQGEVARALREQRQRERPGALAPSL